MKVQVKYLKALLNELIKKTGQPVSKKGFQLIGEDIGKMSDNYLYNKIHRKIHKMKPNDHLGYHDEIMLKILKYAGYNDLIELKMKVDNPIDPQLLSCLGAYYSYVRRSMDIGTVFRSPVLIYEKEGRVWMQLRGARLKYEGHIKLKKGVLFIPLESNVEKGFYHVYQIGASRGPEVLQGTFSGVSNTFEPIAGRAVLIKVPEAYDKLRNAELEIKTLKKSKLLQERLLAKYFNKHSENNLILNRAYTFDVRDLRNVRKTH